MRSLAGTRRRAFTWHEEQGWMPTQNWSLQGAELPADTRVMDTTQCTHPLLLPALTNLSRNAVSIGYPVHGNVGMPRDTQQGLSSLIPPTVSVPSLLMSSASPCLPNPDSHFSLALSILRRGNMQGAVEMGNQETASALLSWAFTDARPVGTSPRTSPCGGQHL